VELPAVPHEQNYLSQKVQPDTGSFSDKTKALERDILSYLIGHRFKEDGCSRDLLLVCHKPMGQVAPIR
jgi:hypothetical protein